MPKITEKLSSAQQKFKREARNQAITMIVTSFSFVAGLAWNEAIKSAIEHFFPTGNGMFAKLIYALLLTILVVSVSFVLTRLKHPEHKDDHHTPELEKTPH